MKNVVTSSSNVVTTTETKNTNESNLNVKIDAPSHIDTNKLMEFFQSNPDIMRLVGIRMHETMNNNGLTGQNTPYNQLGYQNPK
jgi:hypothetical protein